MAELMELTLFGRYQGQQCVDRWNYVANGTPAAVTLSFALASIMGFLPVSTTMADGTIGGELQTLVNAGYTFVSTLTRAVYVDDDFYDSPFLTGTVGGVGNDASGATPLNAYGFRSNRVKQSIGRGYKRFAAVENSYVTSGGELVSGAKTQMQILADLMGDTLNYTDEGNSLTFIPCIVQKEKYHPVGKTTWAYRYYEDEADQLEHTAQGIVWELYPEVRSQVSRQYGRGV